MYVHLDLHSFLRSLDVVDIIHTDLFVCYEASQFPGLKTFIIAYLLGMQGTQNTISFIQSLD